MHVEQRLFNPFLSPQKTGIVEAAQPVLHWVKELTSIKWVRIVWNENVHKENSDGDSWRYMVKTWAKCMMLPVVFQIKHFHTWLWSILSQPAGERKTTTVRKLVSSLCYCVYHSLLSGVFLCWLQSLLSFSLLFSWVSCCSAEHVHRRSRVRVSHLCATPRASRSVWVLHWADRDYTGRNKALKHMAALLAAAHFIQF